MPILEPDLLINAYTNGIFPMGTGNGHLSWFSPNPRGVLPVQDFHVPRSVRAELRRNHFEIRINTAFVDILRACGQRKETWITRDIILSYEALHKMGSAHSIETWQNDTLVGGLYGVCIGGAFFGESMFSHTPGASKAALVWLMEHLKKKQFMLHDTQWTTPHLSMFGGREIPRDQYLLQLEAALKSTVSFVG